MNNFIVKYSTMLLSKVAKVGADMRNSKVFPFFLLSILGSLSAFGNAIDTNGYVLTNETAMGDIDMASTTVGDFKDVVLKDSLHSTDQSRWNVSSSVDNNYSTIVVYNNRWGMEIWVEEIPEPTATVYSDVTDLDATSFSVDYDVITFTATRSFGGYILGDQTNKVVATTNTATSARAGLMTSGDKQKLDGYPENLNATTIPMSSSDNTSIYDGKVSWVGDGSIVFGGGNVYNPYGGAPAAHSLVGGQNARSCWTSGILIGWTNYSDTIVWSGTMGTKAVPPMGPTQTTNYYYFSHGHGTFNINPTNGLEGVYIGETNLSQHISNCITEEDLAPAKRIVVTTNLVYAWTEWSVSPSTCDIWDDSIGESVTCSCAPVDYGDSVSVEFTDGPNAGEQWCSPSYYSNDDSDVTVWGYIDWNLHRDRYSYYTYVTNTYDVTYGDDLLKIDLYAKTNDVRLSELNNAYTIWKIFRNGVDITSRVSQPEFCSWEMEPGSYWEYWNVDNCLINGETPYGYINGSLSDTSLSWEAGSDQGDISYQANRYRLPGYRMGDDSPSNPNRMRILASTNTATINVAGLMSAEDKAKMNNMATISDVTLSKLGDDHSGFSSWVFSKAADNNNFRIVRYENGWGLFPKDSDDLWGSVLGNPESTSLTWVGWENWGGSYDLTATRQRLNGYTLGSQTNFVLASTNLATSSTAGLMSPEDKVQLKPLTGSLYNLEHNAGYYLAVRDIATAMGASITNDPYASIPTPTPPANPKKRYAMFIVPVNNETGGVFAGFELKASTNNFSGASDSVNLQFYSQSEVANNGVGTNGAIDKMKLFTCSSYGEGDLRSYKKIGNTMSWNHDLMSIVVIVDAECLVRNPDPNGNWLTEDNEELTWVYARNRNNSPSYEIEPNTNKPLWRPITPVKWFSKLPKWAISAW